VLQCDYGWCSSDYAEGQEDAELVLGEAVMTTMYVLNRTPTKSVEGATPFEVWYRKNPSVQHL
jgi:hypothetical protein